ncbi:trk system potassium uptake protein TrkH [Lachnospiraceae bacterium C10]|nr:trk system potassium uptake protein TrkH [Lachnospiraceae bacterium C10]
MNQSVIRFVLGKVLLLLSLLLLVPFITGMIYKERDGFVYLAVGFVCFLLGFITSKKKPDRTTFYLKDGCIITALSWIMISIVGALPLVLTGEVPHFIDALFEIASGFTTTGASILTDVEVLSHATLIWRSFTHWIGGMGVLVFLLAIVPLSGGTNINLMRAESPGPSVGKLVPKMRSTATILYMIYLSMTGIQSVLLLISGMDVFTALCMSFGTAGTGGFGILNSSVASYTPAQQWIITIFMIMFGVNFNFYYFVLNRNLRKGFAMEEVKAYFCIIFAAILVIFINIHDTFRTIGEAIRTIAFQVGSIITTTGYSTADFNTWPTLSKSVLVLLMFVGACAGSTGGGFKVSRLIIMFKTFLKEANSYIHPKSIKKIKLDGEPIEHEVIRSVNVYLITYLTIFVVSVLLISIEGKDLETSFTAVAATFNNIGPGLNKVGPSANYADMSYLSKIIMIIDMLAGRLELFPLIILFHPSIWKELLQQRRCRRRNDK